MANAEEDFSFPTNPPPCFFESPPLWRPVPPIAAIENFEEEEEEVEYYEEKFNSSCSYQEFKTSKFNQGKSSCDYDNDKEDKMDMLWEGLNDESPGNCGETTENPDRMKDEFSGNYGETTENSENSSPGREVQVCCVKALKLSKENGLMLSAKKASVLVLVRVLKKGLAMHHCTSVKKRAW